MKNINLIPTDKPSRLHSYKGVLNLAAGEFVAPTIVKNDLINQHIYITNSEEIKMDDWYLDDTNSVRQAITECESYWTHRKKYQKIILTTDKDLIKDGVQAIDDEFLEWFVKNPSCEKVEIGEGVRYEDEWIDNEDGGEIFQHQYCSYKIIIPKEEPKFVTVNVESATGEDLGKVSYIPLPNVDYIPKQETLEEAAEIRFGTDMDSIRGSKVYDLNTDLKRGFIEGAKSDAARDYWYNKWQQEHYGLMEIELSNTKKLLASCEQALEERDKQQERMYSEEDMREAYKSCYTPFSFDRIGDLEQDFKKWFEQFKKEDKQ